MSMRVIKAPGHGKNLYDKSKPASQSGGYIDKTGTFQAIGGHYVSPYIAINPNTSYTVSGEATGRQPSVCCYDADKVFISGVNYNSADHATIDVPANAAYLRFSYKNSAVWQVEEGSVVTPYEPYRDYTFCPFIKDLRRYQPATSSNTDKYPNKLTGYDTFVFDGDESWTANTTGTPNYRTTTGFTGGSIEYTFSDRYTFRPSAASYSSSYDGWWAGSQAARSAFAIVQAKSGYDTLADFKDSLAENPLTVLTNVSGSYYVWEFSKDTQTNQFGYYCKAKGEFVVAKGAGGTLVTPPVYDYYAIKEDNSNGN